MEKPRISIITVCYNSEKYIEECIKSVVNQPYLNKEYLVIDGGSTDGTLAIIERYKEMIDYFVSEPDCGISDAFNKGIAASTGDIIGIINSDDKLEEDALSIVAEEFDPEIDVYRGICKVWNDQTNFIFFEKPTMYWPLIPIKMRGAHPATFVSSSAYNKYGVFDKALRYSMDIDLFIRLSQQKAIHKYINKPLATFRLGGVSQDSEKKRLNELCFILKKNGANRVQVIIFRCYYSIRLLVKHFVSPLGEGFRYKLASKF